MIVAALFGAVTAGSPTLTLGEVTATPPAALAPRVLPADVAARITGGTRRRRFVPGQAYTLVFTERAVPAGRHLCARNGHTTVYANLRVDGGADPAGVPQDTVLTAGPIDTLHEIAPLPAKATLARCAKAEGWIVAPDGWEEQTGAALVRLMDAMRDARRRRPAFALTCATESGACVDARRALATLPLGALLTVEFPEAVTGTPAADGNRVRIRTMAASPAGLTISRVVVHFGPSAPDGRSWFVTIDGANPVTAVAMWRSQVTYH